MRPGRPLRPPTERPGTVRQGGVGLRVDGHAPAPRPVRNGHVCAARAVRAAGRRRFIVVPAPLVSTVLGARRLTDGRSGAWL